MQNEILKRVFFNLLEIKNSFKNINVDDEINKKSLLNLYQYMVLRKNDLSTIQDELTQIGLSSLGRSQSCVLSSLNQNIYILSKLINEPFYEEEIDKEIYSFEESKKKMIKNCEVFGKQKNSFTTKIMVTLPSEAAFNHQIIKDLMDNGASILRINTAHDDKSSWKKMADFIIKENISREEKVKIYVDLAGPKIRTNEIVKSIVPFGIGSKQMPQKVEIVSKNFGQTKKGSKNFLGEDLFANIAVDEEFFKHIFNAADVEVEDKIKNKTRLFPIKIIDNRVFFIANKKVYISRDTKLKMVDYKTKFSTSVYNFELESAKIKLFKNDEIIITNKNILGQSNYYYNNRYFNAIIGCSNDKVFDFVKVGDDVYIDDGKIGCEIIQKDDIGLICKIINVDEENGAVLKSQKGINFPNTNINISAITDEDLKNFEDIIEYADLIGISFAQNSTDITLLQNLLKKYNKEDIVIVPKIETKLAIENLTEILITLLKSKYFAIMIARGDLAVEVRFENLPYIQEEIFDICEAAHIPVIYATQVLESKMKKNLPSRAEVIDAAFAQRADCIMLNKGNYVVDTLKVLKLILRSMHTIFQKNRQILSVFRKWKI